MRASTTSGRRRRSVSRRRAAATRMATAYDRSAGGGKAAGDAAGTSTCKSMRSEIWPVILSVFGRPGCRRGAASSRWPQRHCCVAFLPLGPISLKSLRSAPHQADSKTLGGHLRQRRNESGLHQREVASRMAVSEWTYANWENGRTTPGTVHYKRVIEFLGYYPHPSPCSLGQRLLKIRRCFGMTSRQAALSIGVDHGTVLMWESGRWRPTVQTRSKLERFLTQYEPGLPDDCWAQAGAGPRNRPADAEISTSLGDAGPAAKST